MEGRLTLVWRTEYSSAVHIFASEMYPHCVIEMKCVETVLCLFRFPTNKNITFCSGIASPNELYSIQLVALAPMF